jgi:hypothetical protein
VAYRVIVGEDIPDFRTISDFRKRHLEALEGHGKRTSKSI